MSLKEARALPGGALSLYLLLLGGAVVFISFLMFALSGSSAVRAEFGRMAWLVPTWGVIAVGLAVALRKTDSRAVYGLSLVMGVIGGIGLLAVVFGSRITVG